MATAVRPTTLLFYRKQAVSCLHLQLGLLSCRAGLQRAAIRHPVKKKVAILEEIDGCCTQVLDEFIAARFGWAHHP
jgi:hypothetical protein